MRVVRRALLLTTLIGALVACRGPRDPDLEARLAAARAQPAVAEPAPTTAGAATKPAPAARAATTLLTRSDEEIRAVLAAVPGQGPALHVRIDTAAGAIRCTLDEAAAPQTVANFVALATGQTPWTDPDTGDRLQTPFYDGLTFHRAVAGFIAQTGNPGSEPAAGPGWRIPREPGVDGAYDAAGALGMVDAGDDTHGSQFFITLRASRSLADRFTPFGRCGDLDVVTGIAAAEKQAPPGQGKASTRPKEPVRIETLTVERGPAPAGTGP